MKLILKAIGILVLLHLFSNCNPKNRIHEEFSDGYRTIYKIDDFTDSNILFIKSKNTLVTYKTVNGKKEGQYTINEYNTGTVAFLNYKDNKQIGYIKSYYTSGEIEGLAEIINNHNYGYSESYYKNGSLRFIKKFKCDEYFNDIGVLIEFDKDGQLLTKDKVFCRILAFGSDSISFEILNANLIDYGELIIGDLNDRGEITDTIMRYPVLSKSKKIIVPCKDSILNGVLFIDVKKELKVVENYNYVISFNRNLFEKENSKPTK